METGLLKLPWRHRRAGKEPQLRLDVSAGIELSEAEGGTSGQVDELQHLLQDKQKELQQIADHTHTHLEQNLQLRHLQSQVKQVSPAHTHLWLSPPGFVRGRLLDEGMVQDRRGWSTERWREQEVEESSVRE